MGDELRRSDKGWMRGAATVVAANLVLLAAARGRAEEAPTPPSPPPPAAPAKVVPPAPLASGEPGWQFGFYGWLELSGLWDSTQSFNESVLNNTLARPHTIAGDNPRFQGTAKDSRFGFKVAAPAFGSLKVSGLFESDFFGLQPPTATQDQTYVYAAIRLRQYYAKLETPVLDLLVGQTNDLFGWGSYGFFPNTPAFLGVMGEVFHRNVQLRVSKTVKGGPVGLDVAVAAVRPATRDSAVPDLQGGLRFTFDGWQGASAQGPRQPRLAPAALAVSGVGRRLTVTDFNAIAADPQTANGWGVAGDLFLPIIPASGSNLSNTLSLTLEASKGTGIADLYLTLTGGVLFPALPNPHNVLPAPVYTPNIDQGIVTFDVNGQVRTINWEGAMANAHYHFPFRAGRMLSLSGTFSGVRSSNVLTWTPLQGQAFVWDLGYYIDGTVWWCITPDFQMAVSYQRQAERFGDEVWAVNNRVHAGWWFFF